MCILQKSFDHIVPEGHHQLSHVLEHTVGPNLLNLGEAIVNND